MLKIIELEIDPELSGETGVFEVAWVELPAIEQDFVYFSQQKFYQVPDRVSDYACRAIRENEKRGNPAGTQVGKIRAQQLCKKEEISLETIKRMKSFLERAEVYNTGNWDDNGTIAYGLWGGPDALTYVDKILRQEENFQDEGLENACWEGYRPVGLKPANDGSGRMVPNCVPDEEFMKFVYPEGGESENEFISRCMSSAQMNDEFPDASQRTAVCYSYWDRKGEFSFMKVSFDWDGTLTTERGRNLLKQEIQRGNEVYIISSRNTAPEELYQLVRDTGISPTRVFTVGSNQNKISRIKSLGIERHYDDNLQIRRELGSIAAQFDYITNLPPYQTTSGDTMEMKPFLGEECGCSQQFQGTNIDVFGYKTKNFEVCPGAIGLFDHLTMMGMDEDTIGMVRSAAQIADNVFGIEKDVLNRNFATQEDLNQAQILVDDFKDVIHEIDERVGMKHDTSFMDGHIKLISSYLKPEEMNFAPYPWDECIQDQLDRGYSEVIAEKICGKIKAMNNSQMDFSEYSEDDIKMKKEFDFLRATLTEEEFEAITNPLLRGFTEQEIYRQNHSTPTTYFQYAVKVTAGPPDRDFCDSLEGRYFRRAQIDALRDTNTQFGHNGEPYSKWLYKGGPLCKHAFRKYLFQGNNKADLGWAEGKAGMAPREMVGKGFYPGTPRYEASLSKQKEVSRSYMNENEFNKCFGDVCSVSFNKESLFFANQEQRMIYTPLMIPNLLIPRVSDIGEKYFVKFTPETIERIQRKFMIEQRLRETNLEHTDKKFQDVVMVESWLINGGSDKAYTLGFTPEQVPTGTWMAGYKILDTPEGDVIWNDYIKSGKVRGASVEGNFLLSFSKQTQDEYLLDEIIKILNKISE